MDAILDKTYADHLHFLMSAIIGPGVAILGLVGNVLSLITWCRPCMRSSTGRYLIGQAVADIGVLLFFLLCDSIQAWCPQIAYNQAYGVFYSYIGYPVYFFFIINSIWTTVAVTVDRYILVCWINKAKSLCNERHANFGLFLVAVNCFLINIPHFASHKALINTGNETGPSFEKTEYQTSQGGRFYEFWVHCIILILVPWVIVMAMNVKIINKITASNRKMADKKSHDSVRKSKDAETQLTRLLLTVTFTFLFFIGLQCIIQCIEMQQPPWVNKTDISAAYAFAKTGVVWNSSCNFLLYCLTGRRFRKELCKLLKIRFSTVPHGLIDSTNSTGGTSTTSTTGI